MQRLQPGDPLEVIKPLRYRENNEEFITEFDLPAGSQAEYLGKIRIRKVRVHEQLHPEYITSDIMHLETLLIAGGHEVRVDDGHGFGCYFTFKDWNEVFEYFKVPSKKDHQNAV
ncbi:hypothetical protein [Bacillus sp. JCM 19034]|uniref:hypothetical protein n=1 Tax=Bacillus sp. JCM 19034 TaxID=1481928 RepID=UPI000783408E|nr:hypothetical protein [Bacillus sp. JCM 19034]